MAVAAGEPLLVLREKDVARRGSLKEGYVDLLVAVPSKAGPDWLDTLTFKDSFSEWLKRVRDQKHVFLAYSSAVRSTADRVHRFLVDKLNLSVLDWRDLPASRSIIENIVMAERQTMFGVFLLTKDDREVEKGNMRRPVPRDNVVFEAGFFAGAKGPQFDLIIHEPGAKLPSDLGGFVYLELQRASDISSIETKITDYFAQHFPR
jgi:predicted nucleotide-binding protein